MNTSTAGIGARSPEGTVPGGDQEPAQSSSSLGEAAKAGRHLADLRTIAESIERSARWNTRVHTPDDPVSRRAGGGGALHTFRPPRGAKTRGFSDELQEVQTNPQALRDCVQSNLSAIPESHRPFTFSRFLAALDTLNPASQAVVVSALADAIQLLPGHRRLHAFRGLRGSKNQQSGARC